MIAENKSEHAWMGAIHSLACPYIFLEPANDATFHILRGLLLTKNPNPSTQHQPA